MFSISKNDQELAEIKVTLSLSITSEVLESLMSNVFETGVASYYSVKYVVNPAIPDQAPLKGNMYYASRLALALLSDGYIVVEDDDGETHIVTLSRILEGFNKFFESVQIPYRDVGDMFQLDRFGRRIPDMGTIDAEDSDCIMQYAMYGEVVWS